jgi:hypothetical protein
MGLDGLKPALALVIVSAAGACSGGGGRPARLLDGRPAAELKMVHDSVVTAARVLELADVDDCLFPGDRDTVASDTQVVERVGVEGRSLTFRNRNGDGVYACDGGSDAAGERPPPWCAAAFGELVHGRVLDPRLDVLCRDRARRPLAYAFVDPAPGVRWIGVQQDGYVELYEVLAGLPVRISSVRGVDTPAARATFEVTQYDAVGRELVSGPLEAAVAG